MEQSYILYGTVAVAVIGVILALTGSKERNEQGEWSGAVQWGWLMAMVGVFGILAAGLQWSFTAVLLVFTIFTGAVWLWHKAAGKSGGLLLDNNPFRDYVAGYFPVVAAVFVLRTFVAEPFQIPSSSMRPGLVKGDFILVSKFSYGIRIPVLNTVAIPTGSIRRGDVVVFNYPMEPATNYIKRIVAIGGDVIEYKDKVLTVNGVPSQDTPKGEYRYPDDYNPNITRLTQIYSSRFEDRAFDILKNPDSSAVDAGTWNHYQETMMQKGFHSGLEQNCEYAPDGSSFKCTVPQGKYFAMGDNRDNSADSRYWGFVDDNLIVGKAFMVWLNIGDMSRIGTQIK